MQMLRLHNLIDVVMVAFVIFYLQPMDFSMFNLNLLYIY